MRVTAHVTGLDDLARALKALPREIASKSGGPLRTALRASARMMRDEAQTRAPEDTGRLKRAITVQLDRNPGNVTERLVVRPRKGRSRSDPRGAYYWHFLEFGTVKQAAQPYMRPAFDAVKNQALAKFKTVLAAGILRAARKVARLARGR